VMSPRLSPADLVALGYVAPRQYQRQDDGRYRRGTAPVWLRAIPRLDDILAAARAARMESEPDQPDELDQESPASPVLQE
jgi:hypothetical protein